MVKKMDYIYAVLLLHKVGKEVNEKTLTKVIIATGEEVNETKIRSLITSLKDVNIDKELEDFKLTVANPIIKNPEEIIEVKEEKKKSATDGLFDLFN